MSVSDTKKPVFNEEKEKPVTWGELAEVAKMIGEEAIKLIERSDTEKNALKGVLQVGLVTVK